MNYFQLYHYMKLRVQRWVKYDIGYELGINLNSSEQIRQAYTHMMNNVQNFALFDSICYGKDWIYAKLMQAFYPAFVMMDSKITADYH